MAEPRVLTLRAKQIRNRYIDIIATVCASGAMASLATLYVDDGPLGTEHPALKYACDARAWIDELSIESMRP